MKEFEQIDPLAREEIALLDRPFIFQVIQGNIICQKYGIHLPMDIQVAFMS